MSTIIHKKLYIWFLKENFRCTELLNNNVHLNKASQAIAWFIESGGKSGQYRAPYFLTGRIVVRQYRKCRRKENYQKQFWKR